MPKKKEIAALLITAGALALFCALFFILGAPGQTAEIYENGELKARLPLKVDAIYELSGNQIEISGGAVLMIWADCPDKLCIYQGRAHLSGQRIVCLPNRVEIRIEGGRSHADTVSY